MSRVFTADVTAVMAMSYSGGVIGHNERLG